jgi:hypothetical protein
MDHAGHADVMDIGRLARDLGRDIDAGDRPTDDAIVGDGFERRVVGQRQPDVLSLQQVAVGDAPVLAAAVPC